MKHVNRTYHESGFSLIEVLIALALTFLIGGTLITIMVAQFQLTASHNRNIINQADLRDVLVFMSDEISLTGTSAAEPFISIANPSEFCFVADIDGNGVPDQIKYELAGGALQRTLYATNDGGASYAAVSTDVILPNAGTVVFQYLGPGNSVDPEIDQISSVEFQLSVNVGATSTALTAGKLANQEMTTKVTLRNRLL